jgi:hypothetical protein
MNLKVVQVLCQQMKAYHMAHASVFDEYPQPRDSLHGISCVAPPAEVWIQCLHGMTTAQAA